MFLSKVSDTCTLIDSHILYCTILHFHRGDAIVATNYFISTNSPVKKYMRECELSFAGKQWTAPELLRDVDPPPAGTQKGDVYSFAIIIYELITKGAPYSFEKMSPRGVWPPLQI